MTPSFQLSVTSVSMELSGKIVWARIHCIAYPYYSEEDAPEARVGAASTKSLNTGKIINTSIKKGALICWG